MNVLIYWVNANKLIIVCDTDTETGLSLSAFACLSYFCLFIISAFAL